MPRPSTRSRAAVENILGIADRFKRNRDGGSGAELPSTQQILDSANALMADGARQHRKSCWNAPIHPEAFYVSMDDAAAQAEYIAGKVWTREIGVR